MRRAFGRIQFLLRLPLQKPFARKTSRLLLGLALAVLLFAWAEPVFAQATDWPAYELHPDGPSSHKISRGPGGYFSLGKILFCWFLLLAWVKTTDWASRDTVLLQRNVVVWNSVLCGVFGVAFLLVWMIPLFPIGAVLLVMAYVAPLGAFIYIRNQEVELHQKVLTPDHLRHVFADLAGTFGVKVDAEKKAEHQQGAPVDLMARGAPTDRDNDANLLLARQSPGFVTTKDFIADMVLRRAAAAVLDFTAQSVSVQYQIDGVTHTVEPCDRESGDAMLAVMKKLAGLEPTERSKKQAGEFGAKHDRRKYTARIASQGTSSGERAILKLDGGSVEFDTFLSMGMREKVREQLLEILAGEAGFILFASLPSGGLTTSMDVALLETDRLMRHFVSVEEETRREREIENLEVSTYSAANGETPASILPALIRSYPDAFVVRDLVNAETLEILCDQVSTENRMAISGIRAKDAPEALLRVLMMKVPAKLFAPVAKAVVHGRLVRKLCEECKVGYEPEPDLLKKLGLPPGKVPLLYRESKPEDRETDEPCPNCHGIGYHGRATIFEILVVDDRVREVLAKQPKLDLLKKAAKLAGMRSCQEEGILMVAKGVTSIQELMRTLKQ